MGEENAQAAHKDEMITASDFDSRWHCYALCAQNLNSDNFPVREVLTRY